MAELAIRNTAGAVTTRIRAVRKGKQQEEVVNELAEIINELLDDRNQLIGVARGLEEALVVQRITDDEINYITERIIPTIEQLADSSGDPNAREFIEPLKSLLSVETMTILQLVGFNFKAAIGEPLTQLVQRLILSRVPVHDSSATLGVLAARREVAYLEIVKDPEAYSRLRDLQ